jgi:hypothetical protein
MMRYITATFALFVIVISIAGLIFPRSWVNIVININLLPTIVRLCLGTLLLYYSLFGRAGSFILKPILAVFGLSLLAIFGLYIFALSRVELYFFDLFFVAEGGTLALLAGLEEPHSATQPAAFSDMNLSERSMTAKNSFAQYNKIKQAH